jgi:hypothetical protein
MLPVTRLFRTSQLTEVVGEPRIADLQPDLVQPGAYVLEAVPRLEQFFDVRPRLANLPDLRSRFLPQSCAEAFEIELVVVVHGLNPYAAGAECRDETFQKLSPKLPVCFRAALRTWWFQNVSEIPARFAVAGQQTTLLTTEMGVVEHKGTLRAGADFRA